MITQTKKPIIKPIPNIRRALLGWNLSQAKAIVIKVKGIDIKALTIAKKNVDNSAMKRPRKGNQEITYTTGEKNNINPKN